MTTGARGRASDLDDQLERWVRSGLVSAEQAERIREHESSEPPAGARRTGSLVIEGLGYVGGVLVMIAAVTIAGRYWSELGAGWRLVVVLGAALLLLAAGAAVTAGSGPVGHRLRAVVWALAVVAFGGGAALLAEEVWGLDGQSAALTAGLAAAGLAAPLWWWHRTALQQAVFVAATAVAVATATGLLPAEEESAVGLALWGWGVVWLLLGAGRVLAGRAVADICGGVVVVLGSVLLVGTDAGSALALVTAALLVGTGVLARDLVLLGVGSVATLVTVPVVMNRWFPDLLVAPIALLVAGALLVGGALLAARRWRAGPHTGATGDRSLPKGFAAAAAAVVAGTVTCAVLVLGLW
jgi:hypothetical protein